MPELTARPASEADYPTFVRLFPELEVPDATPSIETFVTLIVPGAIVLCDGDTSVGYAWGRRRGDRFHVVHVIVDPAHRRRGVGRLLMETLARRARGAGFTRWMLNVKPENVGARVLYERCGMRVAHDAVSMRIAWGDVARLPHAGEVSTRQLTPADDARYEEALGAPRGEIASYRALGRITAGIETAGPSHIPLGFLGFEPTFPGVSPFYVRAPAHAHGLLESVRPHALPNLDYLFIFVEANPALESAFAAAGARPAMRLLRMEGDIPVADRI
jgi:GNAT superfamily N-acetyltransferase